MTDENAQSEEPREGEQAELRTLTFDQLRDGQPEVIIVHKGQQYRLRATRNGGLILNK